jgi:hypothetical protein
VPRPEQPLKIWLGTGGSPESVLRAVELGLPMFLGILGGTAQHWAQYGTAYRHAWAEVGHPADAADIAVAVHGFVAADDRQAKATYLEHELRMFTTGAAEVGRTGPAPTGRGNNYEPGGMVFAGAPNEIADRILHLHQLLGHSRQILQMDVGGMPHATFLNSIELLAPKSCRRSARNSPSKTPETMKPTPSFHGRAAARSIARYTVERATPNSSASSALVCSPALCNSTRCASCFTLSLGALPRSRPLALAIFMPSRVRLRVRSASNSAIITNVVNSYRPLRLPDAAPA